MLKPVSCPIGIGDMCAPGGLGGSTDKEQFAAVANHVMAVHHAGPGEAFEAAGRALPWTWAEYVRDSAEHPERYRK